MTSPLTETVLDRLKDGALSEDAQLYIITAIESEALLAEALGGMAPKPPPTPTAEAAAPKPGAFINSITVEGFRGVGPRKALELHPGPGLTLVLGRNGSGKSSFAEAIEVLLTGDNRRWADRSAVWREGWRNLHHETCAVEADLILEGESGPTHITRTWDPDAALTVSTATVQRHGQKKQELATLGWSDALDSHRPFLSYNELGSMLDQGPTKLYEAVAKILGLDDLVEAEKRIKDATSIRKKSLDAAKAELPPLIERLQQIDDERASTCIAALASKPWNLEAVAEAVTGAETSEDSVAVINLLRQVAALEAPTREEVDQVIDSLRRASEGLKAFEGTEAGNAKLLADLLDDALSFHRTHGEGDCPVCGAGSLDTAWRVKTETEVKRLRALASDVASGEEDATRALTSARSILVGAPSIVARVAEAGIDVSDTAVAYKSWSQAAGTEDVGALADHLEVHHAPLELGLKRLKAEAEKEIARREDLWRPMALDLASWSERAQRARAGEAQMKPLKEAADWLKQASNEIRNERFTPIADKTQRIWDQLKQQSNVTLQKITFAGTGNARKVELKVMVDGEEGAALGVMSQGELHALALSLFLPRATLDDSPFRFIVIDDPVQSMDPARVDGLARVLQDVATDRQVVVFTHDDRLPRACRLLGIDAKVIEVYRRLNSVVELRDGHDPVKRYCDDAWAIAKSTELDPKVASRIVGVNCRSAIEAACTEVLTRRRLSRGESYDELDELLAKAEKLSPLMSLALFDDAGRGGEVLGRLKNGIGGWAADTYRQVQDATHGNVAVGALEALARSAEKLARGLVKMQ